MMTQLRLAAALLLAIGLLPTVAAALDQRVQNGDFEFAGDDPTDVPFWNLPSRAALAARADLTGSERDAALLLSGTARAITDPQFPVTTNEPLTFQVDMLVTSGRARAILEFTNINGAVVGLRQYDVGSGSAWATQTSPTILVPAGALSGRVILESYSPPLAPGPHPTRAAAAALFDNVVVARAS